MTLIIIGEREREKFTERQHTYIVTYVMYDMYIHEMLLTFALLL